MSTVQYNDKYFTLKRKVFFNYLLEDSESTSSYNIMRYCYCSNSSETMRMIIIIIITTKILVIVVLCSYIHLSRRSMAASQRMKRMYNETKLQQEYSKRIRIDR